jgi:Uma2 family endonuclease
MNQHVTLPVVPAEYAANAFTTADFLQMMELGAFEDMRAELVGGVIEKMSPAYGEHWHQNFAIGLKLVDALGRDVAIATDLALVIDGQTVRGVDIAVSLKPFSKKLSEGRDLLLAVEIAESTLGRDLGAKAAEYARVGVPTYWVVDLNGHAVHVMSEPSDAGYARREIVRFGEPLPVPGSGQTIVIES